MGSHTLFLFVHKLLSNISKIRLILDVFEVLKPKTKEHQEVSQS